MLPSRYIRPFLFIVVTAIFVASRLWRLDATCLWFDEMFSVQGAEHSWNEILRFVALDLVHPPLFYVLLKCWIGVGGESIFWLRLLPVTFACLAIVPFVLFAREIKQNTWTILLGLFFIAVNGSLIKYAQEVRMYTMLMFLSLTSLWLFSRYFNRGKNWLPLVVVNIILVYTHYYGWLVIGCEVAAIIAFQRMKWRRIAAMAGIVFAAFLPWVVFICRIGKSSELGQNIEWIERPGLRTLIDLAIDLIEPFYFRSSNAEPSSAWAVSIPILILTAIAVGVWARRRGTDSLAAPRILLVLGLLPVVISAIASWLLPYSIWGTRHLIIIAGPIALLLATAITELKSLRLRTAFATLLILFSGFAAYRQIRRDPADYVWCGWEKLIADVKPQPGEPVSIVAGENLAAYHAWFVTRRSAGYEVTIIPGPVQTSADREYFPPRGTDRLRTENDASAITAPHVVLLYRIEKPVLDDRLLRTFLEKGYAACPYRVIEYGRSTVIRVEMTREPANCVYPF